MVLDEDFGAQGPSWYVPDQAGAAVGIDQAVQQCPRGSMRGQPCLSDQRRSCWLNFRFGARLVPWAPRVSFRDAWTCEQGVPDVSFGGLPILIGRQALSDSRRN